MAQFVVSADLYLWGEGEMDDSTVESSYVSSLLTAEDERCFAEWSMREVYDRFKGLYCWEDCLGRLVCEEADSWIPGSIGRSIASDPDNVGSATFTVTCDDITSSSWRRFTKLMMGKC